MLSEISFKVEIYQCFDGFFVNCLIFIIRAVRKIKNFENWISNEKVSSAIFEQFQAAIAALSQN